MLSRCGVLCRKVSSSTSLHQDLRHVDAPPLVGCGRWGLATHGRPHQPRLPPHCRGARPTSAAPRSQAESRSVGGASGRTARRRVECTPSHGPRPDGRDPEWRHATPCSRIRSIGCVIPLDIQVLGQLTKPARHGSSAYTLAYAISALYFKEGVGSNRPRSLVCRCFLEGAN
jgi:hypothetical protein